MKWFFWAILEALLSHQHKMGKLKIPHFFEINGLWKERDQYGILSWLETNLIKLSNYSFCIGLRGALIPNVAHINIENGVSRDLLKAGMANLLPADDPRREVFSLNAAQCELLKTIFGEKRLNDLGLT